MEEELFNKAMAEFERKIETLPESRRPALRALAKETRKRAAEIKEAVDAGKSAAEDLKQSLARLSAANVKLAERTSDINLMVKYARFDAEARARELRGEGRDHG